MKENNEINEKQFEYLLPIVQKDLHGVTSAVLNKVMSTFPEEGPGVAFGAMTANYFSFLFGCVVTDGTDEERKVAALNLINQLLDHIEIGSFDLPEDEEEYTETDEDDDDDDDDY